MAEKLDQKQIVDFKELLMSEVIQSEALINLLDSKNIISKQELLEEMKRVQSSIINSCICRMERLNTLLSIRSLVVLLIFGKSKTTGMRFCG